MKLISFPVIYLAAANILAFVLYGLDKRKAKKHEYRISEGLLIFAAAIGGSAGALAGMMIFRHKTRKKKFTITVPILLLCHIVIIYVAYRLGAFDMFR